MFGGALLCKEFGFDKKNKKINKNDEIITPFLSSHSYPENQVRILVFIGNFE